MMSTGKGKPEDDYYCTVKSATTALKLFFQLSYADDAVGRTNNRHCSLIVPLSWLKVVAVIVGAVVG